MITDNRKRIKAILLVIGAVLLAAGGAWFVVYQFTHGRVVVKSASQTEVREISYCACEPICANMITNPGDSLDLPVGKYVIQADLGDNTSYIANIEVKGWQTTTVTARSEKRNVTKIATATSRYVLPMGDDYLSYDQDQPAYKNSDAEFDANSLAAAKYVDKNQMLMVESSAGQLEDAASSRVLLYDKQMNEISQVGEVSGVSSANIYYGDSAIYIAMSSAGRFKLTKNSVDGVKNIYIPSDIPYAVNGNTPIFAASNDVVAVFSGNDYAPIGDGDEERSDNDAKLTVYSVQDFARTGEISMGTRSDISNLSLSPDGRMVVVIGESSLETYSISTGELIFKTPVVNQITKTIFWYSNDSFIYQLGVGGVYLANLLTKESYSIIDTNMVRVTSISGVVGEEIYLTAFPNDDNDEKYNDYPDGYVINLAY
jgi:hypothetical protein